ncbi:MAG: DUF2062 domain-containing protein [Burkholderiales bacterium]
MPKKLFRKYLPSHESVTGNPFVARFGSFLTHPNLWHLNRRSVAGGVAIGLFAGLVPGPTQIAAATLLSVILKVNLPVAVFTTLYTNPLTIVPLYIAAYQIGAWVTSSPGEGPPAPLSLADKPWSEWLSALWEWLLSMGKPLAVGLPLFALLLAVLGYFAVRGAWRLWVVHAWHKRARIRASRAGRTPT